MKELTVILPIHKIDDEVQELVQKAYASFISSNHDGLAKLIVIGPSEVINRTKGFIDNSAKFITTSDGEPTSFQHLVNKAVAECDTDYFSILEFDDTYTDIWFKNVEKYLTYGLEASVIMPLTEIYDYKSPGLPIAYINECVWAKSFSEEMGYFDEACLQDYMIFNLTGSIFDKSDFVDLGGLKESMKVSFWYEFLLRMLYNKKKIFVLPKIGYHHFVNREDSLVSSYETEITKSEYDFWVDTAKKEYLFIKDRNKQYEE